MVDKKMKNNLFKLSNKGNITVLVLIIVLVVILGTTAMVGYLFNDIKFSELDKGKLRALNIAEAGISKMFLEIEKYNKGEISSLPDSLVDVPVVTGGGEIEGYYSVTHESYSTGGSFPILGYSIISTGTDKSGAIRKVRVNVLTMNIYDFIFSQDTLSSAQNIAGNTTIVGPFLVNGELDIVLGNAAFLEGPLLVKGNIIIGGNSSIGETSNPINLFMGGSMFDNNGTKIDPLNPPGNVDVYVDNLYNSVFSIYLPEIDDDYMNSVVASGAKEITGDLFIGNGIIEVNGVEIVGGYPGYLEFFGGALHLDKNTVVYGDITFGGQNDTIEYSGKANLISTENIYIYSQLIPVGFINFPEDHLLGVVSKNDIYLYLKSGGSYDIPGAALMAIANNMIELDNGVVLRGSSVSDNLTMGQNAKVYFEAGIGDCLPIGMPEFNNILFSLDWQEIIVD